MKKNPQLNCAFHLSRDETCYIFWGVLKGENFNYLSQQVWESQFCPDSSQSYPFNEGSRFEQILRADKKHERYSAFSPSLVQQAPNLILNGGASHLSKFYDLTKSMNVNIEYKGEEHVLERKLFCLNQTPNLCV